jgi:hypothetical protein
MRALLPWCVGISIVVCGGCRRDAGSTSTTAGSASAASVSAARSAEPGELVVGRPAPEITATAHDGFAVKISELKGKHVVLYFYPKDETPGCTKEACAFRDAWKDLAATNVVLVGISTDSI